MTAQRLISTLGERVTAGSEPKEATINETPLSLNKSASKAKHLVVLTLTRALLTRQLLLLALELACTMAAWPLPEVSLRIKCMHIREKRLEPFWNFRELPLCLHQFLILHYLETIWVAANNKFFGKFLLLMMVIWRKENIFKCLVLLVFVHTCFPLIMLKSKGKVF